MTKAKLKVLTGVAAVAASVALLGGSTMAWFTDTKTLPASQFTAGTVKISAGQKVVADPVSPGKKYCETVEPDRVVASQQGRGVTDGNRKDPQAVLGGSISPDGTVSGDRNMFSLGYGGWIVVQMKEALTKGDVLVIEDTWDGSQKNYVETAEVSVSANENGPWTDAGAISNQTDPSGDFHECTVSCPIGEACFIKIVDTTPKGSASKDGFDVDYLCGRNIIDETNWNPGDTDEIAFYVNNAGKKDIQLRVHLDTAWEGVVDPDQDKVVTIKVLNGTQWTEGTDGWYYYQGALSGINGGETSTTQSLPTSADLQLSVELDGPGAGNAYQGKTFTVAPTFEAIQNSHSANTESNGWRWADYDQYK